MPRADSTHFNYFCMHQEKRRQTPTADAAAADNNPDNNDADNNDGRRKKMTTTTVVTSVVRDRFIRARNKYLVFDYFRIRRVFQH